MKSFKVNVTPENTCKDVKKTPKQTNLHETEIKTRL